ncbi:MAG: hypothetical protein K2X32_02095 [Phycisphaerales bacterium]|nr:hypothetical protein [Phycisphaerales bacterium]
MYIQIIRLMLDESFAVYKFCDHDADGDWGELEICLKSGNIRLLKPAANRHEFVYPRAARKIATHWKQGSLPEQTAWAS